MKIINRAETCSVRVQKREEEWIWTEVANKRWKWNYKSWEKQIENDCSYDGYVNAWCSMKENVISIEITWKNISN
jgi:hypothetical protein